MLTAKEVIKSRKWNAKESAIKLMDYLDQLQPLLDEQTEKPCECTETVRCYPCRLKDLGSFQQFVKTTKVVRKAE